MSNRVPNALTAAKKILNAPAATSSPNPALPGGPGGRRTRPDVRVHRPQAEEASVPLLWTALSGINAACHANNMSYSTFINGLKLAGNPLDRKILADIAAHDAAGFTALTEQAKSALASAKAAREKSVAWVHAAIARRGYGHALVFLHRRKRELRASIATSSKAARRQIAEEFKERKVPRGIFVVRCAATDETWVGSSPNLRAAQNSLWFQLRGVCRAMHQVAVILKRVWRNNHSPWKCSNSLPTMCRCSSMKCTFSRRKSGRKCSRQLT